jgi:hypothetical protein
MTGKLVTPNDEDGPFCDLRGAVLVVIARTSAAVSASAFSE